MSMEAHLAELERRHRTLEAEIAEARAHPSTDDLQIVELTSQVVAERRNRASAELTAAGFTSEGSPHHGFGDGPELAILRLPILDVHASRPEHGANRNSE